MRFVIKFSKSYDEISSMFEKEKNILQTMHVTMDIASSLWSVRWLSYLDW